MPTVHGNSYPKGPPLKITTDKDDDGIKKLIQKSYPFAKLISLSTTIFLQDVDNKDNCWIVLVASAKVTLS
jgi:hypothetical protein